MTEPTNFVDDFERPVDFTGRYRRNARTVGAKKRRAHRGRSFLVLAAAVAVPAMAAPDTWQMPLSSAEDTPAITPMAFETPGESFPGSAFYYMVDEPYMPLTSDVQSDTQLASFDFDSAATITSTAAAAAPIMPGPIGAAANPLVAAGSATDRSRAIKCLTQAIYYEARSEPDSGQRAVAQVVLNRVRHPSYPNSVCGVVFQGSQRRTGCQFSFTCDGSMRKSPGATSWNRARGVALAALGGAVYRPVGLATHYHTVQIYPYWAPSLVRVGTIGAHHFYRFGNSAGKPAAFRSAYVGREPARGVSTASVSPAAAAVNDALDPVAIAKAYEEAFQRAMAQNAATAGTVGASATGGQPAQRPPSSGSGAPTPAYAQPAPQPVSSTPRQAEPAEGSGSVRPEYANSGQWIDRPN